MDAAPNLGVFLSSSQEEFARIRRRLSRRISTIPFLSCTPLEEAGADAEDVTTASLRGVREAAIYVGLLGKDYSPTTASEFREALKLRKPCLVYVLNTRIRDRRVRQFIQGEVRSNFKYHVFKEEGELVKRVDEDLRKLLFRFLRVGLETSGRTKRELAEIERAVPSSEHFLTAGTVDPTKIQHAAEDALERGSSMEAIIWARVGAEAALQQALSDGAQGKRSYRSFGNLLQRARENGLITGNELESLQKVSRMRNVAAHEGSAPESSELRWALNITAELIRKTAEDGQAPVLVESRVQHWREVKAIWGRWRDEILYPIIYPECSEGFPIHRWEMSGTTLFDCGDTLPVEREPLFGAQWEHLKFGRDLKRTWGEFKILYVGFEGKKRWLWEKVTDWIQEQCGWPVVEWGNAEGISRNLAHRIYSMIVAVGDYRDHQLREMLEFSPEVRRGPDSLWEYWRGFGLVRISSEQQDQSLVQMQVESRLAVLFDKVRTEPPLQAEAKSLHLVADQVIEARGSIIDNLKRNEAVATLPGACPYC